jgi:hypothetical protein
VEVTGEADQVAAWVAALSALSEGEATEDETFLRKGWLVREKKKFFFTLSEGGYLTWYQKEPNASIPHAKNFVKELTLNACAISTSGSTVNVVKTNKVS